MSCGVYIDFVGGMWRPWKLSNRACKKVFAWALRELGPGTKPCVRFIHSRANGWLYMAVYRRLDSEP